MAELYLMTSASYPSGGFYQEQGLCKPSLDFQPFLPSRGLRTEVLGSGCLQIKSQDIQKLFNLVPNPGYSSNLNIGSPTVIDSQGWTDAYPDAVLLSAGIPEQCSRYEKVLQFLTSESSEFEGGLGFSLPSDMTGLENLVIESRQKHPVNPGDELYFHKIGNDVNYPSFVYPNKEFLVKEEPIRDFIGDLIRNSVLAVHPDGRILMTGTGEDVKDMLSTLAEFYQSRYASKCKQSVLVPYFERKRFFKSKIQSSTAAPMKSPEELKVKAAIRQRQIRKSRKERDIYKDNYFHACESLLSPILENKRGNTTVSSLKRHSTELPKILTQLSAGIAGTGLAVLFSVGWNLASGRAPLCTMKLLNTSIGLGLVWLSWAVNRLRNNIASVGKISNRLGLKEEVDIMKKVDKSVNEIFFRAATIMAVTLLRFT